MLAIRREGPDVKVSMLVNVDEEIMAEVLLLTFNDPYRAIEFGKAMISAGEECIDEDKFGVTEFLKSL